MSVDLGAERALGGALGLGADLGGLGAAALGAAFGAALGAVFCFLAEADLGGLPLGRPVPFFFGGLTGVGAFVGLAETAGACFWPE